MKVPFQLDEFYLDLQEDGNNVSILSQEEITKRPFPGLRPFKTSEFQLFYGRMGQGEELIKRLTKNHFLAVIGSSGTGKSSLVRAGLIPQLFGGYLHSAGSKWDIAICRPGKDPVENLAVALAASKARSKDSTKIKTCFDSIETMLNDSLFGLLDVKQSFDDDNAASTEKSSLLVIIDQFEELFRFDRKDLGKENIENQFVNLLLKASQNPTLSVYVIITMRSEFLGDCVKYRGLPEAINDGQYLVPQLTRNELKEVIENPVKLAGKTISPNLVELLINEIEESKLKENLDQLPILQHALMRTYNNALQEGADVMIDVRHYEGVGEMNKALANHAEDKYRQLGDAGSSERSPSKKQQLAKIIFQSLTELSSGKKSGRRPTELKKIYDVAASVGAAESEVNEVINQFRDTDTSFIMPPVSTALNPEIILDISHESLMRNWARLNDWLTEEMRYKELYRQLNERRELHEHDNEEWLRGTLLRELLDWRMSYANNATWASRYQRLPGNGSDVQWHQALYKSNVGFLNESEVVHEKQRQQEAKELKDSIAREQRSQAAKNRIKILTAGLVIAGLLTTWALTQKSYANQQRKEAQRNATVARLNADEAKKQSLLAVESEKTARREKEMADSLRTRAEVTAENLAAQSRLLTIQSERLRVQTELALEQKSIADKQTVIANKQKLLAEQYSKELEGQKNNAEEKQNRFEKQLVKNRLKKEPFYFSRSLDQDTKDEIIDSLFQTPPFNEKEIELGNHINKEVLQFINEAVAAKETVTDNPENSLNIAREIWKQNQHPVIRKILLSIVNDNVFPSANVETTPGGNLVSAKFSIAATGNGFLIADNNNLVSGKTKDGNIVLNETTFDAGFNRFFCSLNDSGMKSRNMTYAGYDQQGLPVALIDSFRIQFDNNGNITERFVSPLLKNYTFSKMSPDAKRILLADKDGTICVWKAAEDNAAEKIDTLRNYRSRNLNADNVLFAPGSRQVLLFPGKTVTILDDGMKEIKTLADDKIDAVSYANSGKIITAAGDKLTVRDNLFQKDSSFDEINISTAAFKEAVVMPGTIQTVTLSPNWSKAVITQADGGVFLIQNKTGGSLFQKQADAGNIRVKELVNKNSSNNSSYYNFNSNNIQAKLGRNNGKLYAAFSNDSTVITADENGILKLWGIYSPFTDPVAAINTVYPRPALTNKLQDGKTNAAEILQSGKPEELNVAATYFAQQEQNDTAKLLCQKLLDKASPSMKPYYLQKLVDVNTALINSSRVNSLSKQETPEAIKEYRLQRAIWLKENVAYTMQQKTICPNNYTYNNNLSNLYGSLSFTLIFLSDFEGALASASKGVVLNPENDWIKTNLALSELLLGNYTEAEKIYREQKDKLFSDRSRSFREAFLADFKELEKAGIITTRRQQMQIDAIKKLLIN